MSFLEYLGLESLFGDDDGGGIIGIVILVAGLLGWVILAFIKSQVIDQAAMVFNLLACIVLLFVTLKKMVGASKEKNINKTFVIVSSILIVIAFIFGLTRKYHSIIYNYEYNHICSGIAFTFIPTFIINLIYPFFYHDKYEKESIFTKTKKSFGSIGLAILIIIACFLLGQAITVPVALLGKEEIYNDFATYHNISFNEKRKEIENKTVDEFLQETYYEVKGVFNERCVNDNNQNCDKFIKDNYVRWLNEYTDEKYGYKIFKSKSLNDTEEIIRIVDREYGTEYYNYKMNMNDFSLTKISNEEFIELLNN